MTSCLIRQLKFQNYFLGKFFLRFVHKAPNFVIHYRILAYKNFSGFYEMRYLTKNMSPILFNYVDQFIATTTHIVRQHLLSYHYFNFKPYLARFLLTRFKAHSTIHSCLHILQWTASPQRQEFFYLSVEKQLSTAGSSKV